MAKILTLDVAITDPTVPRLLTMESFEGSIAALSPRAWWDASNAAYRTDVSGKCSALLDRTSGGFNLLQATDANRPPVTANYWGQLAGVNRDAIVFDGATALSLKTLGNVFDGTTVWSVAQFIKPTGSPYGMAFSTTSNTTSFPPYPQSATSFRGPAGAAIVTSQLLDTRTLSIATYNYPGSGNATITHDVNGVAASGSLALGVTAPGTTAAQMGGFGPTLTLKFTGGIGEVLVFKSDISQTAGAIQMLKDYFAFKYRASV